MMSLLLLFHACLESYAQCTYLQILRRMGVGIKLKHDMNYCTHYHNIIHSTQGCIIKVIMRNSKCSSSVITRSITSLKNVILKYEHWQHIDLLP